MRMISGALALCAGFATLPCVAQTDQPTTTLSVGLDLARGDYGTAETTTTASLPVAIKHERGRWTFKASVPYVWTEGTFSRESGVPIVPIVDNQGGSGGGADDPTSTPTPTPTFTEAKQSQSGFGDLVLGVFYNLLDTPGGFILDAGAKAKLATADKAKTLITSGENDYSVQLDAMQMISRTVSVFATIGATKKGDTETTDFRDPIFGSLGGALSLGDPGTFGVAWDFREKTTAFGDPVSELTVFYSVKLGGNRKLTAYLVGGLSDGSPDQGGGLVLSQRF